MILLICRSFVRGWAGSSYFPDCWNQGVRLPNARTRMSERWLNRWLAVSAAFDCRARIVAESARALSDDLGASASAAALAGKPLHEKHRKLKYSFIGQRGLSKGVLIGIVHNARRCFCVRQVMRGEPGTLSALAGHKGCSRCGCVGRPQLRPLRQSQSARSSKLAMSILLVSPTECISCRHRPKW
jgi:hypothetical protein